MEDHTKNYNRFNGKITSIAIAISIWKTNQLQIGRLIFQKVIKYYSTTEYDESSPQMDVSNPTFE